MTRDQLQELARKREAAQIAFEASTAARRKALARKVDPSTLVDLDIEIKRRVRASCDADSAYDLALAKYIKENG